jgi:hypothetical protein
MSVLGTASILFDQISTALPRGDQALGRALAFGAVALLGAASARGRSAAAAMIFSYPGGRGSRRVHDRRGSAASITRGLSLPAGAQSLARPRRYFHSRCYAERVSKAVVTERTGNDGLAPERAYALRILPLAGLRGVADTLSGRDLAGAVRGLVVVSGLLVTTLVYVIGRARGVPEAGGTR